MRIARYRVGNATLCGLVEDDVLHALEGGPFDPPRRTGRRDRIGDVVLLAPVVPPRVFGVGLNYLRHIAESGAAAPEVPLLFMKPPTAVIGPGAAIPYPPEARELHFEAELAVVIGQAGRRIPAAAAAAHVLGVTCANDVSERVIQRAEMAQGALLVGKGYDGFCPLGPFIATGLDTTGLRLGARVNGAVRQDSTTADLLFGVAELVGYLSRAITLLPGDVILTGTPEGVGPIRPGDSVEVWVEGVGSLVNPVALEENGADRAADRAARAREHERDA